MGRKAHFDEQLFISSAQNIIAEEGPQHLTINKIAALSKATTGSVYHRFTSLEMILAKAWLEAASSFQDGFAKTLNKDSLYDSILAASLYTARWSRQNIILGQVLLRFDANEFRSENWPKYLIDKSSKLQKELKQLVLKLMKPMPLGQRTYQISLLRYLLIDMPLSAVKPYLKKGIKPPLYVDDIIEKSIAGFKGELT